MQECDSLGASQPSPVLHLQKLQLLLVQLLLDQHQREPRSVYLLWPTRGKASIVAAEMFDPFHNKGILGHNRQCADVTEPHCLIQDLQPHMKLHILYSQHRLQSLYPDNGYCCSTHLMQGAGEYRPTDCVTPWGPHSLPQYYLNPCLE